LSHVIGASLHHWVNCELKLDQMKKLSILLLAAVMASCGEKKNQQVPTSSANVIQVDGMVASAEVFAGSVKTAGTIVASEFVELKPEVSGRIAAINIREGQFVQSGTLLLKLHDEDLQAQKSKYTSQFGIAEKTFDRLSKLYQAGGVNQQELDQVQSQVEGLKADVDFVNAQIRKTEIRAPFSGTLGLRMVSPGAMLSPQDVVGTLIQTFPLKVDFVLPEDQSIPLSNGTMIQVLTASRDTLNAVVIAREVNADINTRNNKYRAILSGEPKGLQPGSFVEVVAKSKEQNQSVLVPTNCIIPDSRSKKVVLIKGGKALFQTVETGIRTEDKVQVLQGIAPGDTIATSGLLFLKPGSQVNIRSIQ
jgi:membrane fusion protein, multidrug efflux system